MQGLRRASFERTTTGGRLKVYCSLQCQYKTRRAEYRSRPDILRGVGEARA
jgi:hypothetical protein